MSLPHAFYVSSPPPDCHRDMPASLRKLYDLVEMFRACNGTVMCSTDHDFALGPTLGAAADLFIAWCEGWDYPLQGPNAPRDAGEIAAQLEAAAIQLAKGGGDRFLLMWNPPGTVEVRMIASADHTDDTVSEDLCWQLRTDLGLHQVRKG